MSAATLHSTSVHSSGATAVDGVDHRHRLGSALRAIKVFVEATFGVVILGEYGEEAGIRRR